MQYNPSPDRSGEIMAAGAVNAAQMQAQGMQGLGAAIAAMAVNYRDQQTEAAKAKAYESFLGVAGPAMGLKGEWLEEFRKMPRRQQAAYGDMMLNSFLPQQQRMEYLKQQAALFPRSESGGQGGPQAGGYVVGQGFVGAGGP